MTTTPDNTATTWRDLADQLMPEQIAWAEKLEHDALGDPAEVAEVLLKVAGDHARKNLTDRMAFGHLPPPAGAVELWHWEESDGGWRRKFIGTERHHDRGIGCAPTEITEEAFAAWSGQHTTWKLETRRAYRNTAQSFARWAHKAGHLATPLELPTVPHPKVSARPTPGYAWRAALARADDRTRLMLRLAGELGLRRTEVAQVTATTSCQGPN